MKKIEVNDKMKAMTPEFRASYPHLFKAQSAGDDAPPKFSVTMLFKKNADLTALKKAIFAAKVAGWGPNKDKWPRDLHSPIKDGDEQSDKEGYAGHWVVKTQAKEESKPGLVNADLEPIISPSEFYAGCYARAQVLAWPYEYMGKKGVTLILDAVQKTKDGKAFSNKKPADQIFSPYEASEADDEDLEETESDDADDNY